MDQLVSRIHPEPGGDAAWLRVCHAVIDRIIPPDDFPGAWDAGAGLYISGQLAGQLRDQTPMIEAGFGALETEARHAFDRSFVALTAAQQDLLLGCIEQGEVHTEWPMAPAAFFAVLVELTAEGYYSDPGNGGNREEVAWRMIGYQTRVPHERTLSRGDTSPERPIITEIHGVAPDDTGILSGG